MRNALLCTAALALLTASACQSINIRPREWGRAPSFANLAKDDVVAIVNRNIAPTGQQPALTSWRCMQAKFQMAPIPVAADGTIIVEAPHSFRMRVSHPIGGGEELDVGSNNDEFWIWQKEMNPPAVLTAHHEDMDMALQHFKIPFQPDWIMEVLGVIPIDGSQYELRTVPGSRHVELITDSRGANGEPLVKIIQVDPRRSWVIGHELRGTGNKLVASAKFQGHRAEPPSGVILPREIYIDWPDAELNLKISLKHVEVNPPQTPGAWQLPHKPGFQKLDMGDYARRLDATHSLQNVRSDPPVTNTAAQSTPANAVAETPAPSMRGTSGARPFPGMDAPSPVAPISGRAPPNTGPATPLPSTGRVRLDSLGP